MNSEHQPAASDANLPIDLEEEFAQLAAQPDFGHKLEEQSYRPELPDCGVYINAPADENWVHPEDRQALGRLLPSDRIWHRFKWDGTYYWIRYGDAVVRVRPSMWLSIPTVDTEVGDQVEVLSKDQKNDPGIYHICDMNYDHRYRQILYRLSRRGLVLARKFERSDFQLLKRRQQLKPASFEHAPPKSKPPADAETLDVGRVF